MANPKGYYVLITLAAVMCGLAIGACGSSSQSNPSADVSAPGIKYADCMRANGVPNLPDPSAGGGGVQLGGSGINPASPDFEAAQKACHDLLPGGGGPGAASESQKLRMFALARCMRAHGVSGFPDPVSAPPGSPVGYSVVFGTSGAFIALPSTINPQSPRFEQAATVCEFPGFSRHA
jgi:hypothetical protein